MSESVVEHVSQADSSSLSAHSTAFNGLVSATSVPRLAGSDFELGGIRAQADVAFANLREDLELIGSGLQHLLHLTIYLTDMSDWAQFNESYREHVPRPYPVRAAIGVKALAIEGMRVELTALAAKVGA